MTYRKWHLTFVLLPVQTLTGHRISFTFAWVRKCVTYHLASRFDWFGQCKRPPTVTYEYKTINDKNNYAASKKHF